MILKLMILIREYRQNKNSENRYTYMCLFYDLSGIVTQSNNFMITYNNMNRKT